MERNYLSNHNRINENSCKNALKGSPLTSLSLAEKVKAKKELQCSNDKVILLFAKTQKMMR
jgi:hypothetical protein